MINPVKCVYALRLSRPLPRHLRDEEVLKLLKVVHHYRDRANAHADAPLRVAGGGGGQAETGGPGPAAGL